MALWPPPKYATVSVSCRIILSLKGLVIFLLFFVGAHIMGNTEEYNNYNTGAVS